jgi:hypothetical protein
MKQDRNEYVAAVMSAELFIFCKANDLPFENADELAMRPELTDFQFGWLISYCKIWDALIS